MGFYDKRIKITTEGCPRLLIMAINSIFKKSHSLDAEVIHLDKEQIIDTDEEASYMDKLVEIEDSRYHIEFQLLAGRMAIRMYEYGVRETLRGIYQSFEMNKTNDWELYVEMPEQVVVFLAGGNKQDYIKINLKLPDGRTVRYQLPCISASQSVDELIAEELYLLIPFQLVQLNDRMNHIVESSDAVKFEIATCIYNYRIDVKNKLEKLASDGILTLEEKSILLETFKDIEDYLSGKDELVNREVSNMGDKDYIMWSERQKMAFEQVGIEKGIEKGALKTKVSQVTKKLIKNNTPEEIADMLEEDLTEITKICDTAAKYAPDYDVDRIVDELLATK